MTRVTKSVGLLIPTGILLLGLLVASRPDDDPASPGAPGEPPASPGETVAAPAPPARGCEAPLELAAGTSVARVLRGGERCVYTFSPDAGIYLALVVEQDGVDVALTLREPGEPEPVRIDSLNGAFGPETLRAVTRRAGPHRLEIRAGGGSAPAGRVAVRVETVRAATPRDRDRDRGTRAFSRAEALRRGGDFERAIEPYLEALEAWQSAGEVFEEAVTLGRIGWAHQMRSEQREAVAWYRRAVERFAVAGGPERQVPTILNSLGSCYRILGDWRGALEYYERARQAAVRVRDGREEGSSLNNLAIVYRSLGKVQRAIDHYEAAIARWREIGDRAEEATTWANVGTLYSGLGRHEEALRALDRALGLTEGSTDGRRARASALAARGTVERRLGRLDASLGSLERSLALRRALGDRAGEAMVLLELGATRSELGRPEAARASFEAALALSRRSGGRRLEARARNELGWLYNEALGEPAAALASFEAARAIFRGQENPSGEASALYGAARAERRRGDLAAARVLIEETLELVESLREETSDPEDRASHLANKQDYYELAIDLLVELHFRDPGAGWAARALEWSERRRARTLLDVLMESVVDRESERARRRGERAPGALAELADGAGSLWPQRVAEAREPLVRDAREIQRLLDDDTVLLEYTLGEARSFLWRVTPTEIEVHQLPGRREIEPLARAAYDALSKSRGRGAQGPLKTRLDELSDRILEPVADRLDGQRLVVVSEEALQYVPFGALPIPGRRERRVIEEHEIVYLPSLSVLAVLRRELETRPPASGLVAVVADPVFAADDPRLASSAPPAASADADAALPRLAFSRAEADAILELVPAEQGFSALGFDASKQTVTGGALAGYRFIHLATHALFDPDNPRLMGIVLSRIDASGRPRDGILRPHEIYDLRLPVDMVTLSACRSGLGKEVRGEGLVGLTQGLFQAGAGRVVVSFWRVDDRATAALMARFYRGIFDDGLRPAAALRAAQLAMRRDDRWQAPYYWAGFFLQGEWR